MKQQLEVQYVPFFAEIKIFYRIFLHFSACLYDLGVFNAQD
jgi:hypothetical protein